MTFPDLVQQFEAHVAERLPFELLETHYTPYAFGSGYAVYRIRGYLVELVFDGKDGFVTVNISAKHAAHPGTSSTEAYAGSQNDFLANGSREVVATLSAR